ncbi:hypothetical protein OH76DRAFT_1400488 [Lentinus brumalis]|uniref:BTB domain-containing protein n=1 Tax=Lentinus brumalis TaxID=2498619 RepID=A0A371DHZ6_9APHY|nr:hypothetical protein OH76DRAFT_1400488 [Polyporus brumalis]
MAIKDEPKDEPSFSDSEADIKPQNRERTTDADGNKRKPDEAGRPHAADAKRIKTGGPAGSEDTRQESDPPRSKCDAFWYKDGNVVVVVGNTAFKLYKARLSRYSIVLAGQFADEGAGRPTMEGCPVYELTGLKVEDFKQFLEALETPIVFASRSPSQPTLISILRASQALDCSTTRAFALEKLRSIWPHDDPTLPGGKLGGPLAVRIIQLSRECGVPELRKRAFYELIRSSSFWERIATNRSSIHLPDADIIALLLARQELQRLWSALVFEPPFGKDTGCPTKTCAPNIFKGGPVGRTGLWRAQMIEDGDFDAGSADPIGHLEMLLTKRAEDLAAQGWCEGCMENRQKAWMDAQVNWWGVLDQWCKS